MYALVLQQFPEYFQRGMFIAAFLNQACPAPLTCP
jgi:hypothetical protein